MNILLRTVVTLALLVPLAVADARPSGGGFRGGFSSQKASPTSTKPVGSRFGGFGSAKATKPASDAPRKSAMASDLDKKAAQDRALSSLDQRRSAKLPPSTPVRPAVPPPASTVPQRETVIVRENRSSGWGPAIMGFMLGSALSGHATAAPPPPVRENTTGTIDTSTPAPQTVANPVDAGTPAETKAASDVPAAVTTAAPAAVPVTAAAPAAASSGGIGTVLARILAWSVLIGLVAWTVAKFRRLRAAQRQHYSLEGN